MALAISASLAQTKKCENVETLALSSVQKKDFLEIKQPEMQHENPKLISNGDNKFNVPDVIMPNASCWWKKPPSPLCKKQNVAKRTGGNRKNGKTKLELTTNAERNSQISDQVALLLGGSNRYVSLQYHILSSVTRIFLKLWKIKSS